MKMTSIAANRRAMTGARLKSAIFRYERLFNEFSLKSVSVFTPITKQFETKETTRPKALPMKMPPMIVLTPL